ncbi:Uncharacterized protein dnl_20890 [Desulfonema limicola]|uniref:Elp3/MiaA/NifB-like radical SAM core domain-containing protein n=1 Tax=Desulfonema limicola TaxID=45656 RepID=A0A975B6P9_9BACT|nr:radical SAM protein [Desulfonema limicola]QTA79807.1 Uncharacterized protein dnl_20890 [Desulfonema limicola]
MNESLLKAIILSKGVVFTEAAGMYAIRNKAKLQNLVYNAPIGFSHDTPQELLLTGLDGYSVVVSCISPHNFEDLVIIDYNNGNFFVKYQSEIIENIKVNCVKEPTYYSLKTKEGIPFKRLISSCGLDELNIWPWHDCNISKKCRFCGANKIFSKNKNKDLLSAKEISTIKNFWNNNKEVYFKNLKEAISLSIGEECFSEHMHVILISGNLSNDKIDIQAEIYSEIASHIKPIVKDKATEGIVAVTIPPQKDELLYKMKESGIDIVVFNLEVSNNPWFALNCPGKAELGRDFFIQKLIKATHVFGENNVWCNFVLGLEPICQLLEFCNYLACKGIVPSANVLHLDQGNTLNCIPPSVDDILCFYKELNKIIVDKKMKPFYCEKALRTSLTNEAYAGRI